MSQNKKAHRGSQNNDHSSNVNTEQKPKEREEEKADETGPLFNCPVCNSEEGRPLIIVNCGHTICDECSTRLDNCPICRKTFSKWMLVENLIFKQTKLGLEKAVVEPKLDFSAILNERGARQKTVSKEYIDKTSEEVICLIRQSLSSDSITRESFSFTIRETEPFYYYLMNRVAHQIQHRLERLNIFVRAEPSYFPRPGSTRKDYCYDIVVTIPTAG